MESKYKQPAAVVNHSVDQSTAAAYIFSNIDLFDAVEHPESVRQT